MEDNLTQEQTFAPSIFDDVKRISEDFNLPASSETPAPETPNKIEIDLDTSKTLVEMPFEIASYLVKSNDVLLTQKETEKLGKLWRGPLERILSQYKDSDIAIAALATLAIAGEKYADVKLAEQRRNSTGDAGQGQDKLRQIETA